MKRYFLIDKRDGRTRSILDAKPKDGDFDNTLFEIVNFNIDEEQEKMIKQGRKKVEVKDGKFSLKDFND